MASSASLIAPPGSCLSAAGNTIEVSLRLELQIFSPAISPLPRLACSPAVATLTTPQCSTPSISSSLIPDTCNATCQSSMVHQMSEESLLCTSPFLDANSLGLSSPSFLPAWQLALAVLCVLAIVLASRKKLTQRIRDAIRPIILPAVDTGTYTVVRIQLYRHAMLDGLHGALATVVSHECYTVVLLGLFWSGRPLLALLMGVLMGTGVYHSSWVKDLLCCPRPHSPPVVRVSSSAREEVNQKEYGMPSSHALMTVSWGSFLLLLPLLSNHSPPSPALIAATALLVPTVIYGRLYLGMHTPIDVAVGATIGVVQTIPLLLLPSTLLSFLVLHPSAVPFSSLLCLLSYLSYPAPLHNTPTFSDHLAASGSVLGLIAGLNPHIPHLTSQPSILLLHLSPPPSNLGFLLRMLLGLPLCLAAKEVARKLASALALLLTHTAHTLLHSAVPLSLSLLPAAVLPGERMSVCATAADGSSWQVKGKAAAAAAVAAVLQTGTVAGSSMSSSSNSSSNSGAHCISQSNSGASQQGEDESFHGVARSVGSVWGSSNSISSAGSSMHGGERMVRRSSSSSSIGSNSSSSSGSTSASDIGEGTAVIEAHGHAGEGVKAAGGASDQQQQQQQQQQAVISYAAVWMRYFVLGWVAVGLMPVMFQRLSI